MPKVSVCVPAYEMQGKGTEMLLQLLDSVTNQSYQDFEIVVSDHSKDDNIYDLCLFFPKVKYIKCTSGYGLSSVNMNNALKNCTGEIIKPVFQDDYFTTKESLSKLVASLENSKKRWAISACHVVNGAREIFRTHNAVWNDAFSLALGQNTLGAPSCLIYMRDDGVFFDDNLIWLMDCDFYYKLFSRHGEPCLIKEPEVTVREWPGNVSNTLATKKVREKEKEYMESKLKGKQCP